MAALGAAAGAFEGDNARAEQEARRSQLSLQGASLAQNDRQFADRQKLDREQLAAGQEENALRRQDNIDALGIQQGNIDKRLAMDEKQFQAGQEDKTYQRGRDERKDAWGEALSAQEMQDKQERIKLNRLQFDELDRASKTEREKLSNRQDLAKTGLGALALASLRNGGIASQAAIELFNKQQEQAGTGIKVSSGVWSKDGFAFKRRGPGQDQNGRPVEMDYDELMNPAIAHAIFKDSFGEDIAKEQSDTQRDNNRFAQQKSLAETRVLPEDRLVKLTNAAKAMVDAGLEVPESLNAQIQGLSGGGRTEPATSTAESPAIAYERERLTGIAKQTKKPAEQQAYVDAGIERFKKANPTKSDAASKEYGMRNDGVTKKGTGWLGELKLPDGGVATEYTIGVNLDGKETEIPTLVPTLSKQEVDLMVNDIIPNKKRIPEAIVRKAAEHAKKRLGEGKSVFVDAASGSGSTAFNDGDVKTINGVKYTRTNGKWISE